MDFSRTTPSTKISFYLLIVAVVVLLFASGMTYLQIKRMQRSAEMVAHAMEIEKAISALYSHYTRMESEEFRALIIRQRISEDSWNEYRSTGAAAFDHLKKLFDGNDAQLESLTNIQHLQDTLYTALMELDESIPGEMVLPEVTQRRLKKIAETLEKILSIRNDMLLIEGRLMAERKAEYAWQSYLTPLVFLFMALFSLVVVLISFRTIFNNKKRIRTSQQLLNKIVDSTENIINYYEPVYNESLGITDFKIVFANKRNHHYLGLDPNEIREKLVSKVFPFLMKGDFEELIRCFEQKQEMHLERQIEFNRRKMWFRSAVSPLNNGILVNARNTTRERESEEALRNQNMDLVRINAELEAFNRVASHDLQEPLRKIQLFISRIQSTEEQQLSEKSREYFKKLENAAIRMQTLISKLLDYSKLEHSTDFFEAVDMNAVLEKAKEDLSATIEETRAQLYSEKLPKISGISFQMEQLFTNLLSNALKYVAPKEIPNIRIYSEKVHREQIPFDFVKSAEHYHKITIADNGIGFDIAQANKIFDLFQRLHHASEYSGTGTGLAICKKIVENHNGFILATSEPGKGSAFVIYLPAGIQVDHP